MIFLCVPLCIVFGMLGGQINKLFRPIGITLSIIGIYLVFHNHPWWVCLPTLIYGGWLSMGYGENSKLMKWFKSDEIVRIVFSLICCVPPVLCSVFTHLWSMWSIVLILVAFQVRMGSWGKVFGKDILPEDIFRWGAVGLSMSISLI